MKRTLFPSLIFATTISLAILVPGQARIGDVEQHEKWEYLVVQGASATNFSSGGSQTQKKIDYGSFGREGLVLEQQLDKLGAQGWELVTISGPPQDPIYHFKRRK